MFISNPFECDSKKNVSSSKYEDPEGTWFKKNSTYVRDITKYVRNKISRTYVIKYQVRT